jgi:hypothetical protein
MWQWYVGWFAVAVILLGSLARILISSRAAPVSGVGGIVGAMVISWRLVDLRPKMAGSAEFLRRYKNA